MVGGHFRAFKPRVWRHKNLSLPLLIAPALLRAACSACPITRTTSRLLHFAGASRVTSIWASTSLKQILFLRLEIHSSNYVFIAMQLFGKKYVVGHQEGLLVMRSNWASFAQRRQIEQQREKGLWIDCNRHKQFLRTGDSQSVSQNRRPT